ncbi:DUF7263 family protein [Halorientalis salina]|uniref:DUF7263 family protein n=1 Tax=Halorientalis salina TaxID=2932266 RepID=UPI0010AC7CAF|nr:hypothetical protein [Halorientalis salina]
MTGRAQTNLPALAVALLVLTTTLGLGMALADRAFGSADRQPEERRVAVALSERLVSGDGALTARANVLNGTAVGELNASRLRNRYPVVEDRAVRIRLDDRTLVESGTVSDGTTVRRIVLVRRAESKQYEPRFAATNETTLPRRTDRVQLEIDTPPTTTLETVRANNRVVLHNASGLAGNATVDVSRLETTHLTFDANRSLSQGDVVVRYVPARTTKATLEVTVGD